MAGKIKITAIDPLARMVEETYAAGVSSPYDQTFVMALLALTELGWSGRARVTTLLAAVYNDMTDLERAAWVDKVIFPSEVITEAETAPEWPPTVIVRDQISTNPAANQAALRSSLIDHMRSYADLKYRQRISVGARALSALPIRFAEAERVIAIRDAAATPAEAAAAIALIESELFFLPQESAATGQRIDLLADDVVALYNRVQTMNGKMQAAMEAAINIFKTQSPGVWQAANLTARSAIDGAAADF